MSCLNSQVPDDKNAELVQKAADGDFEALEDFYARFGQALKYYFAGRGVGLTAADDLVQKIFADLWARRKNFRGEASLETYLFAIARNTLTKEMRRARDHTEKGLKNQPERRGQSHNDLSEPEAELYLEELQAAIEEALAKLTPAQRRALDALLLTDIPLSKSVEGIGCSYGAFKKRLRRARKRLRELLGPFLNDEDDSDKT